MYELKTKINDASVIDFLNSVSDEKKRSDSFIILDMMREVSGKEPKMWGTSIIGFGSYTYQYASGFTGDWLITGFSPRKQNLTIYVLSGLKGLTPLLEKLGKHKVGKGCIYFRKIEDIDIGILREIVRQSMDVMLNTPEKREY